MLALKTEVKLLWLIGLLRAIHCAFYNAPALNPHLSYLMLAEPNGCDLKISALRMGLDVILGLQNLLVQMVARHFEV